MLQRNLISLVIILIFGINVLYSQEDITPAPVSSDDEFFETGCRIFDKIYLADMSVVPLIDWERLVIDGSKVGEKYSAIKTDTEKSEYQHKIITDLSDALCDVDGLDGYFDWDIYDGGNGEYILEGSTQHFDVAFTFTREDSVIRLIEADIYPN